MDHVMKNEDFSQILPFYHQKKRKKRKERRTKKKQRGDNMVMTVYSGAKTKPTKGKW